MAPPPSLFAPPCACMPPPPPPLPPAAFGAPLALIDEHAQHSASLGRPSPGDAAGLGHDDAEPGASSHADEPLRNPGLQLMRKMGWSDGQGSRAPPAFLRAAPSLALVQAWHAHGVSRLTAPRRARPPPPALRRPWQKRAGDDDAARCRPREQARPCHDRQRRAAPRARPASATIRHRRVHAGASAELGRGGGARARDL